VRMIDRAAKPARVIRNIPRPPVNRG
jgi:hypothetical protein